MFTPNAIRMFPFHRSKVWRCNGSPLLTLMSRIHLSLSSFSTTSRAHLYRREHLSPIYIFLILSLAIVLMFVECYVNSHLFAAVVICLYIKSLCSNLPLCQYTYYFFLIFRYGIMRRCAQTDEAICIMRNVI